MVVEVDICFYHENNFLRFYAKITAFRDHNTRVRRAGPSPRQVMLVKRRLGTGPEEKAGSPLDANKTEHRR